MTALLVLVVMGTQVGYLLKFSLMMWGLYPLFLLVVAVPMVIFMFCVFWMRCVPRWMLFWTVLLYLLWSLAVTPVLYLGRPRVTLSVDYHDSLNSQRFLATFQMNMFVFGLLVLGAFPARNGDWSPKKDDMMYDLRGAFQDEDAEQRKWEKKLTAMSSSRWAEAMAVMVDLLDCSGFFSVCLVDGLSSGVRIAALIAWSWPFSVFSLILSLLLLLFFFPLCSGFLTLGQPVVAGDCGNSGHAIPRGSGQGRADRTDHLQPWVVCASPSEWGTS